MRIFAKIAGLECAYCGRGLPFILLLLNGLRFQSKGYTRGITCSNCQVKSRLGGGYFGRMAKIIVTLAVLAGAVAALYYYVYPNMVAGTDDKTRLIFWLSSIFGGFLFFGIVVRILFKVEPAT